MQSRVKSLVHLFFSLDVIYNSNLQMFITGFNNEAVHQTETDESPAHPSQSYGGVDVWRREEGQAGVLYTVMGEMVGREGRGVMCCEG